MQDLRKMLNFRRIDVDKKIAKPVTKLKLREGGNAEPIKTTKPAAAKRPVAELVATAVAAPVVADKKMKKPKVVRDSFTMPKLEYAKIDELKALGFTVGVAAKKSELLRAGLIALTKLNAAELKVAIKALDTVKTGRP